MSDWSLELPCPEQDAPLNMATIRDAVRATLSDPTERRIVGYLLENLANEYRCETFHEARALIDRASKAERRKLLDAARAEADLDPTGEVDARREMARVRRDDPPPPPSLQSGPSRDPQGFAAVGCAEPNCTAIPVDEIGRPRPVRVNKWWCPQHRHLAAEGDLDDWPVPQLRFGPTGLEIELSEEDKAYYAEIEQRREDEDEERREQREAEEAAVEAARQRYDRDNPPVGPVGFPGLRE